MGAAKKEQKFKVGDRVRVDAGHYNFQNGGQGTVVKTGGIYKVIVAFDNWNEGWSDDDGAGANKWGFDSSIDHLSIAPATGSESA